LIMKRYLCLLLCGILCVMGAIGAPALSSSAAPAILRTFDSNPTLGSEWTVLPQVLGGDSGAAAYGNTYYTNLLRAVADTSLYPNLPKIDRNKSSENSRVVLTLAALGKDARDVGGWNLVAPLLDAAYVKRQGVNGSIYALLALKAGNYTAPDGYLDSILSDILGAQLSGGGWALSGSATDPDVTAMALQALALYYDRAAVQTAIADGLTALSAIQDADGGISAWGNPNCESAAQAVIALCANAVNPLTDSRFIKNGRTLLDAMDSFAVSSGYAHLTGGERDLFATQQAVLAAVALDRFRSGGGSIWRQYADFSGAADTPADPDNPPQENTVYIPGTHYEATFWNWVLYIVFFGWLWMK
jgi:hypothetical protein